MSRMTKNTTNTDASYTKGHLRLVDKGNGRIALEPTTIDDSAVLDSAIDTMAESLDISGLRLSDEPTRQSDNPYESGSAFNKAALHWVGGSIR